MLTRKQHELLRFIQERLRESGVPPSFDEMKDALDLRSKSGIHRLIMALEERGFIRRLPNRARALEVIKMPDGLGAPQARPRFSPAIVQGGLGVAAGGNINPEGVSMFECMGGSAPKYTNKNVINPIAAIAAGGMMLDTLGETEAAQAVDRAVTSALNGGKIKSLAAGRMGLGTSEVGDLVAASL